MNFQFYCCAGGHLSLIILNCYTTHPFGKDPLSVCETSVGDDEVPKLPPIHTVHLIQSEMWRLFIFLKI